MHHVAIAGAGELGGAIAHLLARRDIARAITLIDDAGRVAAGTALDIAQAAPIEGFATRLTGSTDLSTTAGAAVVVIAERGAGGEEDALMQLRRVTQVASGAVILCAGASARELIDRGVRELKIPRARLFGSAPEALRAARARSPRSPSTDRRATSRSPSSACRRITSSCRGKMRPSAALR